MLEAEISFSLTKRGNCSCDKVTPVTHTNLDMTSSDSDKDICKIISSF